MKLKNASEKVFRYLMILYFSMVILSCREKEESIHPIVGTWTITSAEYTECINSSSNAVVTYFCTPDNCTKYIFTDDGKFKIDRQMGGVTTITEGTYVISGTSLTTNHLFNGSPTPNTYTFVITESGLSLTVRVPYDCTYTQHWTK